MIQNILIGTINAVLYTPDGYEEGSNYPLLGFLHGIGEKGDTVKRLEAISNFNLFQIAEKHNLPFVIVGPQLKTNYGAWTVKIIDHCLRWSVENLKVDKSRVYLTGVSLGGGGVWAYAQTQTVPYIIKKTRVNVPIIPLAAIAPVCGFQNNPSKAVNITCPIWAFHGLADTTIVPNITIRMLNILEKLGKAPKHTFYPNVKHDAWKKAYMPDNSIENPNLFQWLLQQTLK